jgi:tryptophan synthase alpha chain
VLFTYYNPVFSLGLDRFATQAREAGVSGVLCVDLPPEEAREYRERLRSEGISTIFLVAPTTRPERLVTLDEASTGFIYYVSRTGVTGERRSLPATLEAELRAVRARLKNPLAVGFGIADPEQARAVGRLADGVVIGSAIVRLIEESSDTSEATRKITQFANAIVSAIQSQGEPKC